MTVSNSNSTPMVFGNDGGAGGARGKRLIFYNSCFDFNAADVALSAAFFLLGIFKREI